MAISWLKHHSTDCHVTSFLTMTGVFKFFATMLPGTGIKTRDDKDYNVSNLIVNSYPDTSLLGNHGCCNCIAPVAGPDRTEISALKQEIFPNQHEWH